MTAHPSPNPLRGIGLKILSVTVFTLMAVCVKYVAPRIPAGEAVFFRSFFAMPVIVAWMVWTGNLRHGLDTVNPMGHVWRGLVGTSAMIMGFIALGLLPLPEVTALGYAAPSASPFAIPRCSWPGTESSEERSTVRMRTLTLCAEPLSRVKNSRSTPGAPSAG